MKKEDIKIYIVLFIISLCVLGFFSISTTPLYPGYYIDDSSIFIGIGQSMLDGKILFKEMFDHKGPILFYIEALGQIISWGRNGIFLIQIISMFISMILVYKTLKLIGKNKKYIIPFIFGATFCILTLEEGNTSEELSLPFISLCYYLFFKWITKENWKEKIPMLYTYIYGLCFALVTLMKITNAIGIMTLIFGITIVLVKEKKYKELFKNAGIFILGMATICIPNIIYFHQVGALDEMIYTTFTHNFLYIKNATVDESVSNKILYPIILSVPFIGTVLYRKKNKEAAFILCIIDVISMIVLSIGRGLQHYYIVLAPNVIIGMYMMFEMFAIKLQKMEKFLVVFVSIIVIFACTYPRICYNIMLVANLEELKYTRLNEVLNGLEGKEETLCLCCPVEAYLYCGIIPTHKYSYTQDNAIMSNREIEDEIIADIEDKNIPVIVIEKNYFSDEVMDNVRIALEENYEVVDSHFQKSISIENNAWILFDLEIEVYQPK